MTPTATVVGAGAVGTAVALRLAENGVRIAQAYSRTPARAQALAARLPGCQAITHLSELAPAGACWLTVPDDALPGIATELAPVAAHHPHTLWVHCAGSVPLAALNPLGNHTAVIYPLQSFSPGRMPPWQDIPLWLEATDAQALTHAEAWARRLGPHVSQADTATRAWLHLGAVVAANFSNALMATAEDLARRAGADWRVYLPLMREVIDKLAEMPPRQAQTGPARRGDAQVIERHLALLQAHHPNLVHVYSTLTDLIALQQQR